MKTIDSYREREQRAGEHAFYGSCDWLENLTSFSYGVFPLVAKAGGRGLKKGAAVVRVKCNESPTDQSRGAARAVAEAVCQLLDAGESLPRSVTVGRCEDMLRDRLRQRGIPTPEGLL